MRLIRYRFKTKATEDFRPLIDMKDIQMPWWCSGEVADGSYVIIICYLPKDEELEKYWDDAYDIEYWSCNQIEYSGRFPKPDWIE